MSKAYVDTTILTDALLKPSTKAASAKQALSRFSETLLPAYAIKEFKAGPLRAFVYLHNVLADTNSIAATVTRVESVRRQSNLRSSAMEAFAEAAANLATISLGELVEKYGEDAKADRTQADSYRLSIRTLVALAWKNRRKLTTKVTDELSCYDEREPSYERGRLDLHPKRCHSDCALARLMKAKPDDLEKLRTATDTQQPIKGELQKRSRALRELVRKPKGLVSDETCRNLGDAIIVFFAPQDAVILTTNVTDHRQLANALGKSVEKP